MIITKEDIEKAKTKKGGFSQGQIDMAVALVGSPWVKKLCGMDVDLEWRNRFVNYNRRAGRSKSVPKIINPIPKASGWEWRPSKEDIPRAIYKGKHGSNKSNRERVSRLDNSRFYCSDEWREIRVRVLEKFECKCMMCGRNPKNHGVVVHVDHIIPRSKRPDLSLDFNNLQLLCEDCNLGKKNKYETDWRPYA